MAPICMFNALWFKPEGGLERYLEYGAAVQPILEDAGAEILVPFLPVSQPLEGDFAPDLVGFVRYPSVEAFEGMVRSDAYQAIAHLRTEAITKAVLTRCHIEPEDAAPVRDLQPGVVLFNALWFTPGGDARYDEYLDAVQPVVASHGGRFVSPRFRPEEALGDEFLPDLIFLGSYPSETAFYEFVGSDAYAGPAAIRAEAVDRSVTVLLAVG